MSIDYGMTWLKGFIRQMRKHKVTKSLSWGCVIYNLLGRVGSVIGHRIDYNFLTNQKESQSLELKCTRVLSSAC